METKKLICFDVDGTLTEVKSSWAFITAGLGCSVEKVVEIYKKTESGEMPYKEGIEIIEKMYIQSGKATKQNIKNIFDKIPFKEDAKSTVDFFKKHGYGIYLISSSIDVYLDIVAEKIGADGFFGNASFIFNKNDILSKIDYGFNQVKEKALRINELSCKYKIPVNEIFFVGDDINDIDAFKLTERGIAVWPYDEELGKVAWKKIKTLSEIKNIL